MDFSEVYPDAAEAIAVLEKPDCVTLWNSIRYFVEILGEADSTFKATVETMRNPPYPFGIAPDLFVRQVQTYDFKRYFMAKVGAM